jgi:hypothetical protein
MQVINLQKVKQHLTHLMTISLTPDIRSAVDLLAL